MTQVLDLRSDTLRATVLTRGATLRSLRFGERARNLVLGFDAPADHARIPVYAGAIVGPVANRIRNGRITIDGVAHQMPCNEAAGTALHSGPKGLDTVDWTVAEHRPSLLRLQARLAHGAGGLPGTRQITATYALEASALHLCLEAETDAPTAMNLAAHPYWCLDDHDDVGAHLLQVAADHYLPTDGRSLPIGEQAPVADTAFDFRRPRPVPLTPALDVNFCLARASRPHPVRCASLIGSGGLRLDIDTTAPGLQVYAGAHLPEMARIRTEERDLAPYAAIALEPQFWPDASHHPDFPPIILRPGTTWRQQTIFRLTPPS